MSMMPLRFYTTEQLSDRRKKTPEGFLLIEGVPIARTGEMLYGPNETPVATGPEGYVTIERTPEAVFHPITIASANGKAIVDDHPPVDVCPDNWSELSLGHMQNIRRGEGIHDEFLLADVLVTTKRGIELVNSGKVEVSCGYDADYEQLAPGRGRQHNIIINHLALVDKGRCGPRCAIGDRQNKEIENMAAETKTRQQKFFDSLRKAFKSKDEELLEETLGDAEAAMGTDQPVIHIHNAPMTTPAGDEEMAKEDEDDKKTKDMISKAVGDAMSSFGDTLKSVADTVENLKKDVENLKGGKDTEKEDEDDKAKDNEKLEGNLEMEAPPGTNDRARKAKDSAFLVDSFQETLALAEILVPGIKAPTFDRAADPKKSFDTICNLRRTALDLAYVQPDTRAMIDAANGGRTFDSKTMDCAAIRPLFLAVGAMKKAANNSQSTQTLDHGAGGGLGVNGKIRTPADLNAAMAKRYGTSS